MREDVTEFVATDAWDTGGGDRVAIGFVRAFGVIEADGRVGDEVDGVRRDMRTQKDDDAGDEGYEIHFEFLDVGGH